MKIFEFEDAVLELIETEEGWPTIESPIHRLTFRVKPKNWTQPWEHIFTVSATRPDLEEEAHKAYDIWKGKQ